MVEWYTQSTCNRSKVSLFLLGCHTFYI